MTEIGGIAADQLRTLIERVERLEEEKQGIASCGMMRRKRGVIIRTMKP